MTLDQENIIHGLEEKIKTIISLYEKTKEEKNNLAKRNTELTTIIDEKEKNIKELENKYNTIKLAKTITSEQGNTHEAKLKVNRIIREIDRCIALLNK